MSNQTEAALDGIIDNINMHHRLTLAQGALQKKEQERKAVLTALADAERDLELVRKSVAVAADEIIMAVISLMSEHEIIGLIKELVQLYQLDVPEIFHNELREDY